ncbi:glycoside hydrolase family 28 protein [Thiospirochaeta perfilievii]|uniref:Glycoside hydrolase family 28 protein n=1 Tax=Thiospirochaeta perfilievii TaxID=252967 RepID=A0A5C1QAE5_9SPIO|nr:glycoside hydrolase family 28 protein [Thiospirochaeta perfilievii]QEN04318.1 glycoside hydrolase family 28 protein [Thiospirochaeta perfilievii]
MSSERVVIYPSTNREFDSKIQDVINSLSKKGGGEIVLNPGLYRSKPIELISNLKITFLQGVIIQFSDDFSHYNPQFTRWEGTECYALRSMLFAGDCENIILEGPGVLDGLGQKWWSSYQKLRSGIVSDSVKNVQEKLRLLNRNLKFGSGGGGIETNFLRPSLVQFKNCHNVKISGLTLKDSAFWNTHILYSKNIELENLFFINPPDAPNTDGLDIDSSCFVDVKGCNFNVGDDCLCLKSGMDEDGQRVGISCNNIYISNCSMNKGHGGIVFGSETAGGINNIKIKNCTMSGTDRGIRIKTRRGRGGDIKNININDLKMEGVISPIVVNMYYRCGATEDSIGLLSSLDTKTFDPISTPVIENIIIRNIEAHNIKSSAAFFYGIPESPIKNLNVENFIVTTDRNSKIMQPAMDFFDSQPEDYKIVMNNVENLYIKNIVIDGELC